MKVSRRKLVQVLSAAAATVPLQESLYAQAPPNAVPVNADAELEGARQYSRTAAQVVRQVNLPIATEPAMKFVPRS
ncbi:MAG: hypothetical protein ABI811_09605 [Acidobacteriota bacterium]